MARPWRTGVRVALVGRSAVTTSTSLPARHAIGADGRPNWVGRLLGQYGCARFLLQLEVDLCAAEQRKLRGLAPSAALSHEEEAEIGRYVIRRALVAHGYLVIRRRRISL